MVETAEMTPDLAALIRLCHHRWAIPVVARLGSTRGAKHVTLANQLAIPRESLTRTLEALIAADLVMRNPGYGHPMRPEYILAPFGEAIARPAAAVMDRLHRLAAADTCLNKWPLPILAAMRFGAERFGDLRASLPGVTPRAHALALKSLLDAGLVERRLLDEHPPASVYRPSRRARPLAQAAADLALAAAEA